MSDAFIGLDESVVIDKRIDTELVTVAATPVMRERMQIAGDVDVEIATLTQMDSGAGNEYSINVSLRKPGSGGSDEYGTSSDPIRVDPTGTTTQPVSDAAGSLTIDTDSGAIAATVTSSTADESVFTAETTPVYLMAATTVTDACAATDFGALKMTTNRSLHTILIDNTGDSCMDSVNDALQVNIVAADFTVSVDDAGGALTVDGTLAVGPTVVPGTGATNLGKAEDAPHGTGDVGVMGLAVRRDADTTLADTTGDYAPLQVDDTGKLKVEIFDGGDSHTINGSVALTAADGVDIGDVDVASVIPGVGATNLGKTEDAGHTSADVGVMALAVQQTADTALADTTLDYAPLQVDETGYLKVNIKAGSSSGTEFNEDAGHTTGAAGTLSLGVRRDADTSPVDVTADYHAMIFDATGNLKVNVKAGSASGTEFVEDTGHTTADAGPMVLGVRRDTDDSFADTTGDYVPFQMSALGALKVEIFDGGESHTIDDGGSSITVDDGGGSLGVNDDGASLTVDDGGVALSIIAGVGATDLAKTEDAVHGTGDVGVMSLAVRRDADTTLVDTTGDYAPLQVDVNGYLKVEIFDGGDSHTIDGSVALTAADGVDIGNVDVASVIPGTGATNLGKAEDVGHATGDTGVMALAVQRTVDTAIVNADNDYAPLLVDANGYLKVEIFDGGDGHSVDDGGGSLTVDGTVAVSGITGSVVPGTAATNLGKAEDAIHATADVGVMSLAVRRDADTTLVDATGDYAPLQVDVDGKLKVEIFDGGDSHIVIGNIAAGAADSGSPVKIGGVGRTANPSSVDALDRVDAFFDDVGKQVVVHGAPRDLVVHGTTTVTVDTETTVLAAGAAGVFHDVVGVVVSNTHATTDVTIDFRDSTAGTIRFSLRCPANQVTGFMPPIPIPQATAANNWTSDSSSAITDYRVFIQSIANV